MVWFERYSYCRSVPVSLLTKVWKRETILASATFPESFKQGAYLKVYNINMLYFLLFKKVTGNLFLVGTAHKLTVSWGITSKNNKVLVTEHLFRALFERNNTWKQNCKESAKFVTSSSSFKKIMFSGPFNIFKLEILQQAFFLKKSTIGKDQI